MEGLWPSATVVPATMRRRRRRRRARPNKPKPSAQDGQPWRIWMATVQLRLFVANTVSRGQSERLRKLVGGAEREAPGPNSILGLCEVEYSLFVWYGVSVAHLRERPEFHPSSRQTRRRRETFGCCRDLAQLSSTCNYLEL